MTSNMQKAAAAFSAAFTTDRRDVDGSTFVRLEDGAAEWMRDAVREAHGGMLPDDTRYSMIRRTVDAIAEHLAYDSDADLDDVRAELIDGLIPVYTSDRLAWLASHLDRLAYCDDAASDMGGDGADLADRIAWGIATEYEEIYSAVLDALRDRADELDELDASPFVANWNAAGYMPDDVGTPCEDFESARAAIVAELRDRAAECEERDELARADEYRTAADLAAQQAEPFEVAAGGFEFFVSAVE